MPERRGIPTRTGRVALEPAASGLVSRVYVSSESAGFTCSVQRCVPVQTRQVGVAKAVAAPWLGGMILLRLQDVVRDQT